MSRLAQCDFLSAQSDFLEEVLLAEGYVTSVFCSRPWPVNSINAQWKENRFYLCHFL